MTPDTTSGDRGSRHSRRRQEQAGDRPAAAGGGVALTCVGAGALICLSMPPWGFWPLAILGVALLDRLLAGRRTWGRLLRGWLVTAAWLLGATVWMWDFSPAGYLVLNLFFALFYGVGCALTPPGRGRRPALVGWLVLVGYLRWRWPFGGVPLATLAHSQADGSLAPAARLAGPLTLVALVAVAGVTLSALAGVALSAAGRRRRGAASGTTGIAPVVRPDGGIVGAASGTSEVAPNTTAEQHRHTEQAAAAAAAPRRPHDVRAQRHRREMRAVSVGVAVIALALVLATVAPRGSDTGDLKVALVQGGGPQRTRATGTDFGVVTQRHLDATAAITEPLDLILWPENVVNVDGTLAGSAQLAQLAGVARDHRAWFIPGVVEDGEPGEFLNFALSIAPDGAVVDRYDKIRRVPFGEYVPLRPLFERIAGTTLPGSDARPGTGPAVLDTDLGRFGVVISWEVFFEDRARDAIGNGGTVLLNPTNGASYWLTIVQSQQVASSQLRAIETGRWVLQVAPTGFSAVVNPDGEVLARTGVSEQKVLIADVATRTGSTWALTAGPWPVLVLAALAVSVAPAVWTARRRRAQVGRSRALPGRPGSRPDSSGTGRADGRRGARRRRSVESPGGPPGRPGSARSRLRLAIDPRS